MDDLPGGPLLAERLDKAVREVCPIHGISIGRRQDEAGEWARDTWRVNPKAEATLDEIRAAFDVLGSFDPDAVAAPASPAPSEEHKFPAPDERLSDWDMVGVSDTERGVLKTAMEDGESVGAAKRRLYPILNEELSRLQNQEALLGASTPESVSARRKEVESLLGILARVGDA